MKNGNQRERSAPENLQMAQSLILNSPPLPWEYEKHIARSMETFMCCFLKWAHTMLKLQDIALRVSAGWPTVLVLYFFL